MASGGRRRSDVAVYVGLGGTRLAARNDVLTRWLALLFFMGCGSSPGIGDSGTTTGQLFDVCQSVSDCSIGYQCYCGVCTKACNASRECSAGATCGASPLMYDCEDFSTSGCVIECSIDTDCKTLGQAAVCTGGLCRRPTLVTVVDGGVLTCAERTSQISAAVQATLGPVVASADRTCTTDGDCTEFRMGASCYLGGCGGVDVSMAGAATILAAVKAFDEQNCGAFVEAGCAFAGGITNCPAEGFPTCIAGQCQDSLLASRPIDAGSQ
jgi:hypothetical protein